jgi:hypothetical protein
MTSISRSTIALRIFGVGLDPEELSQLLGCAPSAAAKTGDAIPCPLGGSRIVREGYWRLEYSESDAADLEEKVEGLLGKLISDVAVWRRITRQYKVDIFCGLFLDSWNEGFSLSPRVIKELGDRNLEISFDIYAPTGTWHEDPGMSTEAVAQAGQP